MWMAKPCNQPQMPPITFNHNTPLVMHDPSHTMVHTHHGSHTHGWMDAMANQWRALSVSTMASNAGVCACKKGGVMSEKGTRKKSEKMEKRGKEDKQGRQDALASQHALTSAFISAEHPLTRGRSPWHTAFTNAVCVWQWMTKNKSQVKTQTNHTQCAFGLCLV